MTGCASTPRVDRLERKIIDLELQINMNKLEEVLTHGKIDSSEAAEWRTIYRKSAWLMKFEL